MTIPESAAPLADTKDLPNISWDVRKLLAYAIQAGKSLYETIQSFQNHERAIRDLCSELLSLIQFLELFKDAITYISPIVSKIKLPVLCCYETCTEFDAVIKKTSRKNTENSFVSSRTSFRDWAQIKYLGGDIRDVKDTLSGYKLTIAIALGSLNMEFVKVTRDALVGFNQMIQGTRGDLNAQLESIEDKLAAIDNHPHSEPDPTAESNAKQMEEEESIESDKDCIAILESAVSQLQILQGEIQPPDAKQNQNRRQIAVVLDKAKDMMAPMIAYLQEHLAYLSEEVKSGSSSDIEHDRHRLQNEIESTKSGLEICGIVADQASKREVDQDPKQKVCVFGDVYVDNIHVLGVEELLKAKNPKNKSYFLLLIESQQRALEESKLKPED